MFLSFCCRELGYGYTPPEEIMNEVNKKRKDEKYVDEESATLKHGNPYKAPLTSTPFVHELEYGTN